MENVISKIFEIFQKPFNIPFFSNPIMGQSTVLKFLKKYKKSSKYKTKKWLSARDIYERMRNTKGGSAISSTTTSIKKLRDSGIINYKVMPTKKLSRMIMHYQSK